MKLQVFRFIFPILLLIPVLLPAQRWQYLQELPKDTAAVAVPRARDNRMHVRYTGINRILPTCNIMQFGGNMGLASIGLGWDYGSRGEWETDVLFGYIPKNEGDKSYATLTLKETYVPWSISLGGGVAFEPLSAGIYFNSILSRDFWVRAPEKYPYGYYGFSTKIRLNVFVGEGITFTLPQYGRGTNAESVTLFYEFGATDLYVISGVTNRYLKFWDIFGISFGLKVKLI